MTSAIKLIESIELSLATLRRAQPVAEVVDALRSADNELSAIVDFVDAGYTWED